ncbi:YbfB/YjiJ family MFS transporter, partial [Betaproteobacteria bacterium]|nr:YbfB/YjiJ family MFS transporter [Betaproteobacteria bacterium]
QNQLRWNEHWLGFGALSLLLFFPAWFLRPIINEKLITKRNPISGEAKTKNTLIDFICILSMYFFAGLGFVVSATFTLALAVERGFVQEDSLLAWLLVGVVSIPSLFFWDYVEKRASMFLALFSAIMMHALSLLLAVFFEDFSTFVISTLLFGMSNLGIVSLTMTLAGRLNPANASKEMARLTFGFALALIIGLFLLEF